MKPPINVRSRILVSTLTGLALLLASRAGADEVKLEFMSKGASAKLGGYMPLNTELSTNKPEGIKKLPDDLTSPLYGELKLGASESPKSFFVVLDEPEGKPSRLFVDANGNGDLTDDAAAEWKGKKSKTKDGQELTMYQGGATFQVPFGSETLALHMPMYKFDKNDPNRKPFASKLFYYPDYARSGEVSLGGKSYPALLASRGGTGDFRIDKDSKLPPTMLLIDLNGDGKFNPSHEAFPVNKPFNIGGTTYEIANLSASGGSFEIAKSTQTVEETKPMPSLSAGHKALAFEAKTTDGKAVNFPDTYKGKVVLIDFWATWCGPCVAEMPNVIKAHEKFNSQGFEVLGVSLDKENAEEKLAKFTDEHKMPWAQIYDGKYWQAAIAKQYGIESIPHAYLVDGDTGMIVAEGENIRGEKLAPAIEKALAKKSEKPL